MLKNEPQTEIDHANVTSGLEFKERPKAASETTAQETFDVGINAQNVAAIETFDAEIARTLENPQSAQSVQKMEAPAKELELEYESKQLDVETKRLTLEIQRLEFELKKRAAQVSDSKTEAETQKILRQLEAELAERKNDLFVKQAFTAITLTMLIAGVLLLALANVLGYVFVGGALGLIPVILKAPAKPSESGKNDK